MSDAATTPILPQSHLGNRRRHDFRTGMLAGTIAYLTWGFVAIYFRFVIDRGVSPAMMLAYRISWSFAFLLIVVTVLKQWDEVWNCLKSWKAVRALAISTLLIACNWYVYIYAIDTRQLAQASLGYFMNPLVNVVLGVIVLRESIRRLQVWAVLIAAAGVAYVTVASREFPLIAVTLAVSFGLYGLLRKTMPAGAIVGLTIETALITPITTAFILWNHAAGSAGAYSLATHGWLALSGIITATPLLLFALAARRLKLTTMGFLQFLSPMLQLLIAVWWFGEPFTRSRQVTFVVIWIAIVIFMIDQVRNRNPNDETRNPNQ